MKTKKTFISFGKNIKRGNSHGNVRDAQMIKKEREYKIAKAMREEKVTLEFKVEKEIATIDLLQWQNTSFVLIGGLLYQRMDRIAGVHYYANDVLNSIRVRKEILYPLQESLKSANGDYFSKRFGPIRNAVNVVEGIIYR